MLAGEDQDRLPETGPRNYWYIYSITDIVFIIVLVAILTDGNKMLGGGDTGFHIRIGDFILDNSSLPHTDVFSNFDPPARWIPNAWLADVIFAAIHRVAGLTGVIFFVAVLIAGIHAFLFRFMRFSGISILVAGAMALMAAGASATHWLARPHVFPMGLLLVWYIILEQYQYRSKNYLYWLPLLMIIWVNVHGSFAVGALLIGIYMVGNYLIARFSSQYRTEALHKSRILGVMLLLSILAALINPQGYRILLIPFQVAVSPLLAKYVIEWLSPDFHKFLIYEYILLLMIVIFGVTARRINVIEVMLILVFTYLSLYAGRFMPLFAIIVTPILGRQIDGLVNEHRSSSFATRFLESSRRLAAIDSSTRGNIWSILAVAVVVSLAAAGRVHYEFDKREMPVDALHFAQAEGIRGKMFNEFTFGNYVLYAAWPEYKTFVDGRLAGGEPNMKEYLQVAIGKPGWQDVLSKHNISWVLIKDGATLSTMLLENKDWHLIYADSAADIFLKDIAENQPLIEKYRRVGPLPQFPSNHEM